jgi:hypothetical protein
MRTFAMAAGAALLGTMLLLPAATEAQDAATPSILRLLPRPPVPKLKPAASSLQRTGTLNVTINVPLTSNIPPSQTISCGVTLLAEDISFSNFASASGVVKRSGKTGTCKFSIPYIFHVLNTATTLQVSAAVGPTENSTFTLEYSAMFSEALVPVPTGTTNLTVTLGV